MGVFPVVLGRERQLGGVQLLRLLHHVEELAFAAFGGGFDHQNAVRWHSRDGACDDFLCLVGVLRANLPELGDVQAVDRARAHGCCHADGAVVVRKKQLVGVVSRQRETFAQLLGQVRVSEFHLVAEDHFCRVPVLSNDAAALVGIE